MSPGRDIFAEDREEYFRNLVEEFTLPARENSEAAKPVPTILHPVSKSKNVVSRMKLSQKIGYLLFLHRMGSLSPGGQERLLFLQERAPLEAISAGLAFCQRLLENDKLRSDFRRAAELLNSRPSSKRFRKSETRRIGVGYRDKGSAPDESLRARRLSTLESFVFLADISEVLIQEIQSEFPSCLTEDGEWVDLALLTELARSSD